MGWGDGGTWGRRCFRRGVGVSRTEGGEERGLLSLEFPVCRGGVVGSGACCWGWSEVLPMGMSSRFMLEAFGLSGVKVALKVCWLGGYMALLRAVYTYKLCSAYACGGFVCLVVECKQKMLRVSRRRIRTQSAAEEFRRQVTRKAGLR